jgi:hypothetical protein
VRSELAAEKLGHERAEQALRDAQSTITNLTKKLHDAQQALTAAKAGLAAECQQGQESVRKSLPTPPTVAPAGDDQAAPAARRPRGRPRKAAIAVAVEKTVRKPREKPVRWW